MLLCANVCLYLLYMLDDTDRQVNINDILVQYQLGCLTLYHDLVEEFHSIDKNLINTIILLQAIT